MSNKMPEVGDVWALHGNLIRIMRAGREYDTEYVYVFMKLREQVLAVECYSLSYIKSVGKYLGKSKANINQLFEVQND